MKTINLISLLFLTILLWRCQKDLEIQPKEFPFVITNDATQIDSTGVTFNAKILDFGKEEIIDFGFTWKSQRGEYICSLKESGNIKDFSFRISSDLNNGEGVGYRAFVKTRKNTVYANTINFVSKGSKKPVIKDFYPKEGYDSTKVTIIGSNFSYNPENNHVTINGLNVELVQSSNDTIVFILPETNINGVAEIMVQVGENKVVANEKFQLAGPVITGISVNESYAGDIITIFGSNFIEKDKTTELFWGSTKMGIVDVTDTKIVAFIGPIEELLASQQDNLNVFVGTKKATSPDKFTILQAWMEEGFFSFALSLNYQVFTHENEGYVFDLDENNIFRHQSETNSWKTISNNFIPGSKFNSLCIPQNQFVYKIGGYDYKPDLVESREFWRLDLYTYEWKKLKEIPFSYIKAVYFIKNGFIHIITDKQEHWKCDFENETFQKLSNSPVKLDRPYEQPFMQTFLSTNRIFFVSYGQTFEYDYETDIWIRKANYPIRIEGDSYRLKCVSYNNKGYIIDFLRDEIFQYNVNADSWRIISFVPHVPDAFTVGTKFIVWSTSEKLYITGANSENSNMYSFKNF